MFPVGKFAGARLKIDRANKHISDIEAASIALKGKYTSSVEQHGEMGQSIKYECPDIQKLLAEIALMTGDAIHNLRVALDHAWVDAIGALGLPVTKWTRFPVCDHSEALRKTLLERTVDKACPALFERMITEIKPYPGGDGFIWPLHDTDILDKHVFVIPVVDCTTVDGISVKDENGVTHFGDMSARRGSHGVFYLDLGRNLQIKDKGKIRVSIIFQPGSALEAHQIPEELTALSRHVMNVVGIIESLVL